MLIKRDKAKDIVKGAGEGVGIGTIIAGGIYTHKRSNISKNIDKEIEGAIKSGRNYKKWIKKTYKEDIKKINDHTNKLKDQTKQFPDLKTYNEDLIKSNQSYKRKLRKDMIEEIKETNSKNRFFKNPRYRKVRIGREIKELNKTFPKKAIKPILAASIVGAGVRSIKKKKKD